MKDITGAPLKVGDCVYYTNYKRDSNLYLGKIISETAKTVKVAQVYRHNGKEHIDAWSIRRVIKKEHTHLCIIKEPVK